MFTIHNIYGDHSRRNQAKAIISVTDKYNLKKAKLFYN